MHHLLEMQNPLPLLDCLVILLCLFISHCACLDHWGCLLPIGSVWHLSSYSLCSAPDTDYSYLVLCHYATSWAFFRWTFSASFFCVICLVASLTAHKGFVKCGNRFEKLGQFFFSHFQGFFQLPDSPNRTSSVPYLSG